MPADSNSFKHDWFSSADQSVLCSPVLPGDDSHLVQGSDGLGRFMNETGLKTFAGAMGRSTQNQKEARTRRSGWSSMNPLLSLNGFIDKIPALRIMEDERLSCLLARISQEPGEPETGNAAVDAIVRANSFWLSFHMRRTT